MTFLDYWEKETRRETRLNERYNSWRSDMRKVTNKIITDWINSLKDKILFDGDLESFIEYQDGYHTTTIKDKNNEIPVKKFEKLIKKSHKPHDKLLRYIIAEYNGSVTDRFFIRYTLRGKKLNVMFDGYDDSNFGPLAGTDILDPSPNITIHYKRTPITFFEILKLLLKNTSSCYSAIEYYITLIQSVLYHELTHVSQVIRGRNLTGSITHPGGNALSAISYFTYFTDDIEMEATYNEVYIIYKKRGKYEKNKTNSKKIKRKNFFDILLDDLLGFRMGVRFAKLYKKYKLGEIGLNDIIKELGPAHKLMVLWSIFVYGLESDFKDLILRDNKTSIINDLDLNIIKQNVENIKNVFLPIIKEFKLTTLFCRRYNEKITSSTDFINGLFSTTKSNEKLCREVSSWLNV